MNNRTKYQSFTYAQIVEAAQQRKLDFDLDGDGVSVKEELRYGLNPYCADTDGDNVPDGREISERTKPGRKDKRESPKEERERKQQLRERYFEHACSVLGWSSRGISYDTLYRDINGNRWIGKALDGAVFERAVRSGQAPQEAAYLLAQSPYLQFLKERGELGLEQMMDYAQGMLANYEERQPEKEVKEASSEEEEWQQ